METFLGEQIDFWIELKNTADASNTTLLIKEIASLRARVSFYEDRVKDMGRFRETVLSQEL
jgi:hypothetical protein